MLEKILDFSKLGGEYENFLKAVRDKRPCSIFGMSQPERVVSSASFGVGVLYLTSDFVTAKRVQELFSQICDKRVVLLPAGSDISLYKSAQSNENNVERIKAIYGLAKKKADIVVASMDSLFSYLSNKKEFLASILNLKVGGQYDLTELTNLLVKIGYRREALVDEAGQFSVRGDILDIFPINAEKPFRIEFFDIEITSIKSFDIESQESDEAVNLLEVCPYTDLFLDSAEVNEIIAKLEALKTREFESAESETRFVQKADEIITKLNLGDHGFSLDYLFPLIEDSLSSIFDYLDKDTVVVYDEVKMCYDALVGFNTELASRRKALAGSGEILSKDNTGYLKLANVFENLNRLEGVAHQKITTQNRFFEPASVFNFKTNQLARYTQRLQDFVKDVNVWLTNGFKVFAFAGDEENAKLLKKKLSNSYIDIEINKHASIGDNSSAILPYEFSSGFILPTAKVVVVGTYDLFARKAKTSRILASRQNVFSVPKIGDYVVHSVHGIGICEGVTKLTGNFGTKDFIVVRYRDDDKLYVPIDQMNLLDRFSGAETPKKLSKIGGAEFGAVKEKVKKTIKKMAFDLLTLYATREARKGFKFLPDDELQLEFENSFPYTETEDQLKAISEVKADMESDRVMDRLICGDVGFGKTEVALRAIFKAVLSGKQVAFMAPTTILAEQHYHTCVNRFKEFGINVGLLNRFKTKKEVDATLRKLQLGQINVICGTHRLLSKDVQYFDLGLIVLDEEQKFGVEDKERIKLAKTNVDVLTLSATPIPRTLHMSLSGLRDVSIISTPPSDRLPVQTYVTEFNDNTIKYAVQNELMRDGQVFIVFNRVEGIYAFAKRVQELVPEARIVVGHGQLAGSELEEVIYKFSARIADVLICTTIIENGIDIPNANTLVVVDSDKFGLSQLYQIRGRVGRGNRTGYAYFTYKPDKSLTEESYKRLEALSEFTEFGSGFKIAMRDLEIRGSGNILGAEQHGHIQKVGYDLYCKMLAEAVDELKGKPVQKERDVLLRVNVDAFIPESYITDSENRMTVYKNISAINSEEARQKVLKDLDDVFGKIPRVVRNLVDVAYIKSMAQKLCITEVYLNENSIKLNFDTTANIAQNESLANAIYKYSAMCVLNLGDKPTIVFRLSEQNSLEALEILKDFLKVATE